MKILVLGATGMLGNEVFTSLGKHNDFDVWGSLRSESGLQYFPVENHSKLICDLDVLDEASLSSVFLRIQPDVVINCVGVIKQLSASKDPLVVLPINAMLPHRLLKQCQQHHARLIHLSTDCVFSGRKGSYVETDISDAEDLYGKSKYMGEVTDAPEAITLRTSIIGHELHSHDALIDWFLSQTKEVNGYVNAIFSGLPTYELARVMMEVVIPNPKLMGLYHVASAPINKYELLTEVAKRYGKKINIISNGDLKIDRSLNAERFLEATGYRSLAWPDMIDRMFQQRRRHVSC